MRIPIFRLEFEKKFIQDYKKGSENIFLSGRPIGEDRYVAEFEKKFKKLIGAKYAVAVSNGTVAIELALRCLNIQGKTVLIPANTFSATAIAAINAGGNIGLVDVEEENFSLSPNELEKEINRRHKNNEEIGAVIVVHIGGIISKHIKQIINLCKKYKIPLIEDAAHAHCSSYMGLNAGIIGMIGCFSFFPTKVMTTGEGGMLTTNSKRMATLARSLKNFGRDEKDIEVMVKTGGSNYKISEFTGLLGSLECDRVMRRIKKRNTLTNIYLARLKGSSFKPVLQEGGISSQYKMILRTKIEREWLRKYCKKNNIVLTGEVYKTPINKQPIFKNKFINQVFPVANRISKTHICPPLYPELSNKEVHYICDILLQAEELYEKQGR